MPNLIPAAITAVQWAVYTNTAVTYATAALIANAVVYGAIVAATAYGIKAMTRKPTLNLDVGDTAGSKLAMTRDSIAPRRIIYGTQRVSGPLLFATTTSKGGSNKNEYLHFVVGLAGHEVHSIGNVFFNDTLVIDSDNVVQAPFTSYLLHDKLMGSTEQTSSAMMISHLPSYWTTDHRLRGIAALYTRLEYNPDVYPQGYPNISAVVMGKKVLDLRNSTTTYSSNPALVIYDYLRSVGVKEYELNTGSFITAANICDELVTAPGGGTEKRYECHYSFLTSEAPNKVLENMLTSCHGKLSYDGQFRLLVGAYISPTLTITEDDLRGGITVQRASLSDIYNSVRGVYTDGETATSSFQAADFVPVTSSYYISNEDGGTQIYADLQLPCTIKHTFARRLAKLDLLDKRQDLVINLPTKLVGLRLNAGDTFAVDNTRMAWTGKPFEVLSLTINPEGGVDIQAKETTSDIYDWTDVDADVDRDLSPNTNYGNRYTIPPPTGFSANEYTFTGSDGTWFSQAVLTWDTIGSGDVRSLELMYKKNEVATYTTLASALSPDVVSAVSPTLENGITYDFRARNNGRSGANSVWVSASLLVTNDTTPPSVPTNLAAISGSGYNLITWDFVTDGDIDTYNLYRHTSNDLGSATFIYSGYTNNFVDYTAPISTQAYYWLQSEDIIGNTSSFTGPVTSTAAPGPTDGLPGTDGDDAIVAFLTNESVTLPADSSGNVTSYTGATTDMRIFVGQTEDTDNWTLSKNDINCSGSISGRTVTVTSLTADVGYSDITASRSGYPDLSKRFTLSKSKAGNDGANAKLVVLTSDSQTFAIDSNDNVTPSTINFVAVGQNLTGSPTFVVASGSATLGGSANTRTLAYGDMSTEAVSVRVEWDGVEDTLSVVKVRAGANGTSGVSGTSGVNGAPGLNSATIYLYQRSSAGAPSVPGTTLTYTFSTGVLSGTLGSWTQTIPSGTDPLYITTATALSSNSTDDITSGEWATPRLVAQNGNSGAMVFIYIRSASTPTLPSATTTYTFATAALTGLNNGWSTSVPTNDGNPLWVSAASAVASGLTDTIGSGEWSSPSIMAANGANGANGSNGTSGTSGVNGTSGTSGAGATFTLTLTPTYYLANVGGAGTYSAGTVVNITADANAGGYDFLQWSGAWGSINFVQTPTSNNTYVVMSSNIDLSADYNN